MFVLFRAAENPATVPPNASEDLRTGPPWYEVVYARWVRKNDFDPAAARPGDRVLVAVSPGESHELVLTSVEQGYGGIKIWKGAFPGRSGIPFQAFFAEDGQSISSVSLELEGSKRLVIVKPMREMPGWFGLQDLIQRVPQLSPSADARAAGDDIARPLPPKLKRVPKPPENNR